ncbi:MAG: DNA repair protein RadC [Marinobacter sp.]|jgi:DNA repair protein RadC|uniref:DNA repair protein RadC n=1 Tax=Isoalcanivorax pacificus W11-5 TaxID=391936 RepID=A0A0B4XQE7_9GAMM|nr:DNA repair protein RadC [Isoalcanivorax pacificus]AJD48688.1 DNA repair protein RadC [Isoalcanivorax pacificus W11-5]MDX5329310.1 DNA repair protein RadC [Marinobacter sp.]
MSKTPYIKNDQGLYRVRGYVSPDQLVQIAADILLEDLAGQENLTRPEDAARFLQLSLAREKNEHFAVLFLNNKHQVISFERLFTGTIDGAAVYPRVVVQRALENNAAAVIFAHNHPSGCPDPSEADRAITRRLTEALGLVDVRVLDHFVVSQSTWVSLAERGWL